MQITYVLISFLQCQLESDIISNYSQHVLSKVASANVILHLGLCKNDVLFIGKTFLTHCN